MAPFGKSKSDAPSKSPRGSGSGNITYRKPEPAGKTTLGHKRTFSAMDTEAKAYATLIESSLAKILHIVEAKDVSDMFEFAEMGSAVKDTLKAFRDVQARRAEDEEKDVTAISFSKLLTTHYNRLGVMQMSPPVNLTSMKAVRKSVLKLNDRQMAGVTQWDSTTFTAALDRIDDHVKLQHEASSRLIIDQCLFALVDLCKTQNIHLLLFLELQLSSKVDEPVAIENCNYVTVITGTTDYASIAIETQNFQAEAETLFENAHDLKSITGLVEGDMGTFFLLEAKSVIKDLKDCVPQAIAQSLAVHKTLELTDVGFCVTSGEEWIFGVLRCSKQLRSFRCSEVFELTEANHLELMTLLLCWATRPAIEIYKNMTDTRLAGDWKLV